MKRAGIINGELAAAVASLRHTDLIAVTDAGFPVGQRDRVLDLSIVPGTPGLWDVLTPLLQEIEVEDAWVAEETPRANPAQFENFERALPLARKVPHSELKSLARDAVVIVRTGDSTPYSNVILRCGYPF